LNSTDPIGVPVDGIYADYMLEVRGVAGRITSQNLYAWTGSWSPIPSSRVVLAKNAIDIEGSIAVAPTTNTTRMVFEATDWSSNADWTIGIGAPAFAPSSQLAVGTRSFGSTQTNGFGGLTFYLRDAAPGGPPISSADCPVEVKSLSTTQGSLGVPLTLSSGSKPCFFTDPASSSETIYAGLWSSSLDLSITAGTVLNVTFALTGDDGLFIALICSRNTTTTGGVDRPFECPADDVSIAASQRIRLRVEFISGLPIELSYDGSVAANNSSIVVPVPEFGDGFAATVATVVLVLALSWWRRRFAR